MIATLLQGLSLGFAAGMSPGPLQAFLLTQTLQHGWRRAIWLVLSPLISDAPVVALILLVLQEASDILLRALSLFGGAYVLYLAWGLWQQIRAGTFTATPDSDAAAEAAATPWAALRKAIMINVLGPGLWLYWSVALGPQITQIWQDSPPNAVSFVVGFYSLFLLTMAVQVILFHQARRLGARAIQTGLWIGLAAMVIFALSLWANVLTG